MRGFINFQQLSKVKQEHAGAVDASTPEVAYGYADGSSANTARRTSITYPDGRVIEFDYGASGAENDLLSRLASLEINGETDNLVEYDYVGRGGVVEAAHPEPQIDLPTSRPSASPWATPATPTPATAEATGGSRDRLRTAQFEGRFRR